MSDLSVSFCARLTVTGAWWQGLQCSDMSCIFLQYIPLDLSALWQWVVKSLMFFPFYQWICTKQFKKGNRVSFWPLCLTPLWGGGHIARHVWRWVIVPLDLARSSGVICAHYRYRMVHRTITNMHAWFESTRERQLTLNKIIWRA